MKNMINSVVLFLLLLASVSWGYDPMGESGYMADAREAVKSLQETLQKALQSAVAETGMTGAIDVCNLKAMPLAKELSKQLGAKIGRTALRLRNPQNAPDLWEQQQLEQFLVRFGRGEDLATMESTLQDETGLRYMKAVPMGAACLACHGPALAPSLKGKIESLYPQDRAVGFQMGDLRGAFTISLPYHWREE